MWFEYVPCALGWRHHVRVSNTDLLGCIIIYYYTLIFNKGRNYSVIRTIRCRAATKTAYALR